MLASTALTELIDDRSKFGELADGIGPGASAMSRLRHTVIYGRKLHNRIKKERVRGNTEAVITACRRCAWTVAACHNCSCVHPGDTG